jgi:hypothetical protein
MLLRETVTFQQLRNAMANKHVRDRILQYKNSKEHYKLFLKNKKMGKVTKNNQVNKLQT